MTIKTTSWPTHSEDEILAVNNVLASGCTNYWTGTECRDFEKEFAKFVGTRYAVALMNGTVALEAALYALDIGPGDEVITSCRTFIASASSIVMRGAIPVLADIDVTSQNITVETIAARLTPRTKAIIVVHLAGWPADMENIMQFAKKHHLKVIEDCAQAHGASIKNKVVGSFGDVGAFSFCQDKIITTGGEGGMITTDNEAIWEKIWAFKDHGKNYKKIYQQSNKPPGFRWLHDSFGTNWRMTEMQATIGRQQLKKLPTWLHIRKRNADILTKQWQSLPALRLTLPTDDIKHAYYKYYTFVRPEKLHADWSRDRILTEINAQGVACFVGSCSDINLEDAFKTIDSLEPPKLTAQTLGETSLMFLVHPTLTEKDMQNTADIVTNIIRAASKT